MNKYAIVTGAAKGIGRSIAFELARRKYNLLLADIDGTVLYQTAYKLKGIYNISVECLEIDLSEEGAGARLKDWSKHFHDYITIVVNNAGYGLNAAFTDIPFREHVENINVNVRAMLEISYLFIPILNKHPKAYLLNVASTTAYQSVPYLNVYASTKAFMLSFTRGLRYELRGTNISVSALSPGSTDTDFVNRAKMGKSVKRTAEKFNMSPDTVAGIAVEGLMKGKAEIIPGLVNKLNALLPKFFPKAFVEKVAARIYKPKSMENEYRISEATHLLQHNS